MLGRPTGGTYPILPLAPGTPLAMGALTWGGDLGIGLATDPSMLDAAALGDAIHDRLSALADLSGLADLAEERDPGSAAPLQGQEQPSA